MNQPTPLRLGLLSPNQQGWTTRSLAGSLTGSLAGSLTGSLAGSLTEPATTKQRLSTAACLGQSVLWLLSAVKDKVNVTIQVGRKTATTTAPYDGARSCSDVPYIRSRSLPVHLGLRSVLVLLEQV